ncbi:MAG: Methyltransferase type 11 [Candidatus Moranbacteria bacterium GW2011_GWC2_37_8]|nr:MAG: Methyltransferase type 11 [Candidatus Moranbacteria bacterium GW2011_GWC2_37_8]KKQ62325.1 MAG: Methyltransferase type 11 [Parcubacteria group bacterium GW2011_GWC1_38_22]KKQ80834.1 MAG: Methyltransferase type 11 [Candidatus Moranbacteria bacterium GW2011_GWD2_38_7]
MEVAQAVVGKFLDPDAIIAQIDVQSGSVVADFGCGPGYFTMPFAKIVGQGGKVYSLDVLPQALETVVGKSKNSGIINIETKRVNLEKENGSKLESETVDWVVMKDILFQNQKKDIIIAEAHRILKPGGAVIVIEWNQAESAIGPDSEIRIKPEDLKKMFESDKFIMEKDIEAGDFHYAFIARK